MKKGWEKRTLGDIYDLEGGKVQTGPFGSQLHQSDYKERGIAVIMPKDIIDDRLDISKIARISATDASRLKKHIVQSNDIIFPRRGDIAKRIIIDQKHVGAFCGTGCIKLRGTGSILNPKFLFYYLKQESIVYWIEQQAIGATMLNLNTSILRSVPISLPPLPTQRKIASILSSYDDLIENNLKRIKLLEEKAQLTYEEWFVRMKFPGWEKVKVDEETGLPVGWEETKIGDFVKTSSGGTPSRKKESEYYQDGIIPWIRTGELRNFMLINSEKFITSAGLKGSSAKLFPANTVLLAMYGNTIGETSFATFETTTNQACCAFLVGKDEFLSYFIHQYLLNNKEQILSHRMGAAQENISQTIIKNIKIVLPDKPILELFSSLISKNYDSIKIILKQNQLLKEARDLLLPRLMMGMINVDKIKIETYAI